MAALARAGDALRPDVVVIGGGPAGLASAIALANQGASVLVCEARADPANKPCGEGLQPQALRELCLLGLKQSELVAAGRPLRGVRYVSAAGRRAEGLFRPGPGLGVRRSELQALLHDLAQRTPGLQWVQADARLYQPPRGALSVKVSGSSTLTPHLIIAADGLHSRARQAAGLPFERPLPLRYGVRQHFRIKPWTDHVEVYFSAHAEAYVTPTRDDEVNLALLWQAQPHAPALAGQHRRVPELSQLFPALAQRLSGAVSSDERRAHGPLRVDVPRAGRDGLVLVGDAAGYVDAITGEGVGIAVAKARLLARLLGPGLRGAGQQLTLRELEPYLRGARALERNHVALTRLLLAVRRTPWLLERTIGGLASDPRLFEHFLRINQGAGSAFALPLRSVVGLVRRLTWPEPSPAGF